LDRVDLFRIFVCVMKCMSFARAAEMLGMPRSSVSAAISELERRVDARLLHRTTRKVSPTQEGLALYERCQRVIAEVEVMETLYRRTEAQPSGRLRVDVPGRIGRLITPHLTEFLDLYPRIDIDLGVTDRWVNLVQENVDCALRVGKLQDTALIARRIGVLPLVNVASPAYLARHGTPLGPDDLDDHWGINYPEPSGRGGQWEWVEERNVRSVRLRCRVTVRNAETYIACCLAGLGLIQVPAYDVRDLLAAGELVEVMPEHRAEPMPMSLIYPHRKHPPRRLTVFTHWLEMLLKQYVDVRA